MYQRIKLDGTIIYPYNLNWLRKDYPNTSFPKEIPDALAEEYGVFKVHATDRPPINKTQRVVEDMPSIVNGKWVQVFNVENRTVEDLMQEEQRLAEDIRSQRNSLLTECDWTQLLDSPTDKQAWAQYRQALRDITKQAGFPYEINWPEKP